jgi:hypothetical protein
MSFGEWQSLVDRTIHLLGRAIAPHTASPSFPEMAHAVLRGLSAARGIGGKGLVEKIKENQTWILSRRSNLDHAPRPPHPPFPWLSETPPLAKWVAIQTRIMEAKLGEHPVGGSVAGEYAVAFLFCFVYFFRFFFSIVCFLRTTPSLTTKSV